MHEAVKDRQTVTESGERIERSIDGVSVRRARTHEDERGDLTEVYDPAWGVTEAPMVYAYQTTIRPGRVRGWVYHEFQADRLFISMGSLKVVLYDMRENSPTHSLLNEIYLSERNRGLIVIPPYVVHAVQNIGRTEGLFINLPTRPYNHANPDKFRIALDSERIPYSFDKGLGW